jgi:hypothetical protein
MRIQNLVDEYRAGATSATDRISDQEHVFFLLNGIPDEWNVPELYLIGDKVSDLAEDPNVVVEKLRAFEDAIKTGAGNAGGAGDFRGSTQRRVRAHCRKFWQSIASETLW